MNKTYLAVGAAVALALGARLRADEVSCERFPDADSVLVDGDEYTEYRADGTYVSVSTRRCKVLTEKGRRSESRIELSYSARYDRAAIESVSVIGQDGVEREVDVSATTKETADSSSAGMNIYDPMDRVIVCTVPGLAVGDTLCCRTRTERFAPRVKDHFSDISVMEWTCPIVRQTFRVKAPAGRPLARFAVRNPLGNVSASERRLDDGSILYTWTATNSPQCFPEPDMPPLYTQVQNVRVSTHESWEDVSRWYWGLCLPHLEKTSAGITNKVEELVRAADGSRDAALRAVFRFVSQEVRYMGLTMEDEAPGYAPHDVDITFDNRYGVCRDKAALLSAMLRIAGFDACPALIQVGAKIDPEVPLPFFNHAIVAVRDAALSPGGYILLDPTDEASRDLMPAYLSNRSYLVARPEGDSLRVTPSPPASGNAVVISGDGTLERDGSLLLESHVAFGGINDNAYRRALLGRRPERRRKLFEQIMKGVASGAELLRADIFPEDLQDTSRPLEARLLVRFPETLLKGDRSMTMSPPLLSRAFGAANWLLEGSTSLERRRFPLVVSSTAMVEERLRIALGDAVGEALSLPDDSSTEGAYSFSRTFRVEDGSLSVNRSLSVNSVEFPPEDYQDLREAIKRVEADERRPPVFARNGLADANVRYLLDREEWWLSGPDSWTVTNTVWKQVLTYEGKKRHSEFKLAYNPLWKRVELLEASVSNGADRVSFAGARETNEFECSWAASAPRYPASRELVVNLPSVEIGSVIRLKYAVTVTNAPSAFRRTWYFDTTVPADEKVVVFNGAARAAKPPRRVPDEPMQPDGALWRDAVTVNSNSFARAAAVLRLAADVPKAAFPDPDVKNPSLKDVRDWMAKNVRVVGPSLYELPVGAQLTAPAVVLKERYASRLDYVRTMCALLRGAGFDADMVFAWNDADEPEAVRRRYMHEDPAPALFSTSLVRVRTREGGFLWWGGRRREVFVGTENEYSPIGATAYDGADFLDPGTGRFAKVRAAEEGLADRTAGEMRIFVRENGAVDVDVEQELFGPSVGAFRRRYAEMLPEDRSRHHQAILGEIAQAASATSDLVTDVESYPARLAFNAYIPNFATISGDTMSITVPEFGERLFGFAGNVRETPMAVASAERETSTVFVTFPPGYAEIEHLPESYAVRNPMDGSEMWYEFAVETSDEGGRITVRLRRERSRRSECHLEPCYFALLKDWDRIGAGKANRTIVVRKTLKYPIARSGEK